MARKGEPAPYEVGMGAEVVAAPAAPPKEFPVPVFEFAQTHSPGRDVELMGGFLHYATQQGWTVATPTEWALRFEAFRSRPA